MQASSPGRLCRAPRPAYLALLSIEIQHALAYPAGALVEVATSLLSVATIYYLWRAIFNAQPVLAGFDWRAMQAYVLVSNAIFSLLSATSSRGMMEAIRTGAIASELLRPYSFLGAQFARALGRALTHGAASSTATVLIGFGLAHIPAPPSADAAALFGLSAGLSFLISFLLNTLLALLCFWTKDSEGLLWAYGITSFIFSGGMLPLVFLPAWAQYVALALPFQGIIHTPLQIYQGALAGAKPWAAIGVQVLWVGILAAMLQVLWRRGLRAAELPGG